MSAASCSKVMVSEWQDGRVGFLFLLQGKGEDSVFIYAFIGNGPAQIQKIANAAIQPLHHVNVTFDGETSTHIAVGACEFDNPFTGTPARIFCTVETSDGQFVGEFISDIGEPVSIRRQIAFFFDYRMAVARFERAR